MLLRIDDLEPATFLLLIIFSIAFMITYSIFESNLVVMLGIFNLLLLMALSFHVLHNRYFSIWFGTMVIMLYIEFGREQNDIK